MTDTGEEAAVQRDIRPSVVRPAGGRGMAVIVIALVGLGGGFFYALQINRANLADKAKIDPQATAGEIISSPPELAIPPASAGGQPYLIARPPGAPGYTEYPGPVRMVRAPGSSGGFPAPQARAPEAPMQLPTASLPAPGPYMAPTAQGGVVFQAPAPVAPSSAEAAGAKSGEGRVKATQLSNPSNTVPQGSVIHAVMETALDSTRPGFARAIVSRDVVSFDGSKVLIPKGSKLFGEYKADLNLGEKRALIQWHRLTRPDGAIIDVDSPAADPLGRAGLKGKVNTHFFERFGGVILQSVLDLGVRAATREASGDTIVLGGVPPTVQGAIVQQPGQVRPTLKARQGTSITVFVGRDLDFSSVE